MIFQINVTMLHLAYELDDEQRRCWRSCTRRWKRCGRTSSIDTPNSFTGTSPSGHTTIRSAMAMASCRPRAATRRAARHTTGHAIRPSLAKHLDFWRWQHCRAGKDHPPNYWLAMNARPEVVGQRRRFRQQAEPARLLRRRDRHRGRSRPCPWSISRPSSGSTMPSRIASGASVRPPSASHLAEMPSPSPSRPSRPPTDRGCENRPRHHRDSSHARRCFRRPFGQDYISITDDGPLENWIEQLDWFEQAAEPPKFAAIYQALRSQLVGSGKGTARPHG